LKKNGPLAIRREKEEEGPLKTNGRAVKHAKGICRNKRVRGRRVGGQTKSAKRGEHTLSEIKACLNTHGKAKL